MKGKAVGPLDSHHFVAHFKIHKNWGNHQQYMLGMGVVGFIDHGIWVCLKMGYTPNEIDIFNRDNDQQNHWV